MPRLTYTTPDGTTARWRDRKRYLWIIALIPAIAVFIAVGLVTATGLNIFWWAGPIILFGIVPLIDILAGEDGNNPPEELVEELENDRFYRWTTYAFVPFQLAAFVTACYIWANWDLSLLSNLGLALTVGVTGGIGINTAHELGHKKESVERWLSKVVLAQSGYGHFYVEHNRGHHVRVATPEDAASSRLGENFYLFWPRTVWGSLTSGWELEKSRLQKQGKTHWSIKNEVLNAWLMSVVLFGAMLAIFGIGILPWLLIQAVFGFSLLEVVNYLEHYGLQRQKLPSGRYERCTPRHSWNSDRITTNVFLYHLQRHSDHHANPTRRYQVLRSFEESPQLPLGYGTMIVVAAIPALWRKVMDDRVVAHYGGDITLANIQPAKREKYLTRYANTGA
ncbi:alkane 1-monooxygenase [Tomitella biformata]|uniref:alkane 1-monooxygenase n=1 Tax=Tomitella biformata TaxID=630403 RepID=UPI00068808ED|nr:alkane 1-monooxygenase [Tomitella biformata]